ncbi:MAG: dephospho-CoA kinase [Anaerolineae bacterium]|nr:dephospho-CoA kinase [Anaerolineae bacterium]
MARGDNKYIIGLTGNIAVGKSVVRRMLQHLGAYTIDADGLSHQAMMPGAPAYKPVADMFGRYILDANGQINRSKLGAIAFALPDAMTTLERIVHPVVGSAVKALISRASQRIVVVEAIKLLEGNLADMCDTIWVVDAPADAQIERLVTKRNISEAEARQRIAVQNPQADKLARANVVIYNGGNVDETWKQVQTAWNNIFAQPATPPTASASTGTAPAAAAAPAVPAMPASSKPSETQEMPLVDGIRAKRGTPSNAEQIADFIHKVTGKDISRMDIMLGFGQKSYLMAQKESGELVAVVGWQVENLITSVDELYIASDVPAATVVRVLVDAIEKSAHELQSEVSFVFWSADGDPRVRQGFVESGYTSLKIEELTSPAWREAAREQLRDGMSGLFKALRPDRVTRPI